MDHKNKTNIIVAWPPAPALDHPYMELLRRALEAEGVVLDRGASFTIPWLWRNRRRVRALHFHWLHPLYRDPRPGVRLRGALYVAARLIAARLMGYRLVWTVHNLMPHDGKHPRLDAWVRRWMARTAHALIVHGNAGAEAVAARWGRRERIRVALQGNYIGWYPGGTSRAEARSRLDLPPDAFVFLCFGSVRANKGLHRLVRAFAARGRADERLVVAGPPLDPEAAKTLRAAGAGVPGIRLDLRRVPDAEVQPLFAAADVGVFPYEDILSSGAVELALSFGLPVVAPRLGCIPDMAGETAGVLYDPPDGLAAALEKVRGIDLASAGREARRRAESHSWAEHARIVRAACAGEGR
jgi:beta-1,4-mannosyltransferase